MISISGSIVIKSSLAQSYEGLDSSPVPIAPLIAPYEAQVFQWLNGNWRVLIIISSFP